MYSSKILRNTLNIFLIGVIFYTFQSCKKHDIKPQFYFTADIDGVPWNASVEAATIDSNGIVTAIGFNIQGQDTSRIIIGGFDDKIQLNNPIPIDSGSSSAFVQYFGNIHDLSTIYYTLPIGSASSFGAFNITQLNLTNKLLSGTFNTIAISQSNVVVITNGKFKFPFINMARFDKDFLHY